MHIQCKNKTKNKKHWNDRIATLHPGPNQCKTIVSQRFGRKMQRRYTLFQRNTVRM
jgi:hypothetical protein